MVQGPTPAPPRGGAPAAAAPAAAPKPAPGDAVRRPRTDVSTAEITGAESIVRSLEAAGVETVFGIPGGAILPTYDPLMDSKKIRHILVRHEQGGGHVLIRSATTRRTRMPQVGRNPSALLPRSRPPNRSRSSGPGSDRVDGADRADAPPGAPVHRVGRLTAAGRRTAVGGAPVAAASGPDNSSWLVYQSSSQSASGCQARRARASCLPGRQWRQARRRG